MKLVRSNSLDTSVWEFRRRFRNLNNLSFIEGAKKETALRKYWNLLAILIKILQKTMFQYIIALFSIFQEEKTNADKSLFRFVQAHEFKPFKTIFLNLTFCWIVNDLFEFKLYPCYYAILLWFRCRSIKLRLLKIRKLEQVPVYFELCAGFLTAPRLADPIRRVRISLTDIFWMCYRTWLYGTCLVLLPAPSSACLRFLCFRPFIDFYNCIVQMWCFT